LPTRLERARFLVIAEARQALAQAGSSPLPSKARTGGCGGLKKRTSQKPSAKSERTPQHEVRLGRMDEPKASYALRTAADAALGQSPVGP
jgi:hypothetical protein